MNTERVAFMEKHTSLVSKKMTVSVEQVSIFLTSDGSVISFFENSADDVEYDVPRACPTVDQITLTTRTTDHQFSHDWVQSTQSLDHHAMLP